LMWAAIEGKTEIVKSLIAAGASLDEKDSIFQKTALMWAAESGSTEIVDLLKANGAK